MRQQVASVVTPEADLDERDGGDLAGGEGGEIDADLVGVETNRDEEAIAGGDGAAGGGNRGGGEGDEAVGGDGEVDARCLLDAVDGDADRPRDRADDVAHPVAAAGGVVLDQGPGRGRAVAGADALIGGGRLTRGRAGAIVDRIAPQEAVEATAPGLEEGQHLVQVVERADARPGVPTATGIGPAGVAHLPAGAEDDDLGAPLRASGRPQRHREREDDLVESGRLGHRREPFHV